MADSLFLPFLWLVNWVQFREAVKAPNASDNFKMYVRRSIIGFAIVFCIWVIWLIVFYTNMDGWGQSLLLFQRGDNVL